MPRIERSDAGSLWKLVALKDKVERLLAAQEQAPYKFFESNPAQLPFKQSRARNRWFFAGNRAGKTYANAHECACFAMGWHPYRGEIATPNVGWVVSPDSNLSEDIMEPMIRQLLGDHHIAKWSVKRRVMELVNGSVIHFKSAEAGASKFTGKSIKWAGIDEDCPEEVYREILMRTFQDQGDIWGTITPLYSSWMYRQIFQNQFADPEIACFHGSIFDNSDHVPIAEIERIKNSYSKEELEARLYGKFLKFAGLIYKEFDPRVHVVEPTLLPKDWPRFRFIDQGISDECACLWLAVSPDDAITCYREYYKAGKTVQENAANIREMSGTEKYGRSWIDWASNRRTGVGNSQNKSLTIYREWMDAGIRPLALWPKTEIQTKINKVQQRLLDRPVRLKVFRGLVNLCSEFTNWGREKSGLPERGGDHLLDCLGAACLVVLRGDTMGESGPIELRGSEVEANFNERPSANQWF